MSRTADISFSVEALEAAEQIFVALIGWQMIVIPDPQIDIKPFTGELVSIGVQNDDGQLKGIWRPVDGAGNFLDLVPEVMLDLYDELDRVEVL